MPLTDRKALLRALESCVPGLSHGDGLEQGSSFILTPGKIRTFSDEVLCTQDVALELRCAVPNKPILETLRKLTEDEIDLTLVDNRLVIKCHKVRQIKINVQTDITLHCERVDQPGEWVDVAPIFADALAMVAEIASKDSDQFAQTCVRFTAQGLEATDMFQAIRYKVPVPVAGPILVRRDACKAVNGLGIAAMSETENWVHWKTYTGLIVSVMKYSEEFPNLGSVFSAESKGNLKLPASLLDSLQKANIFLADTAAGKQAVLRLKEGKMMLRGVNEAGSYEEIRDIGYDGPAVSFGINPNYLQTLLRYDAPCVVTDNTLRVRGDGWCWVSSLEEIVA